MLFFRNGQLRALLGDILLRATSLKLGLMRTWGYSHRLTNLFFKYFFLWDKIVFLHVYHYIRNMTVALFVRVPQTSHSDVRSTRGESNISHET